MDTFISKYFSQGILFCARIFGDIDGVCIVPREIEDDVFGQAFEKARGERRGFEAIRGGMKAQESWDTFGIM